MNFSELENKVIESPEEIITPKSQVIIDKKMIIDNKVFHFISAFEEEGIVKFIVVNGFMNVQKEREFLDFGSVKTNREELLLLNNNRQDDYDGIFVKALYLDNKEIETRSSEGFFFCGNPREYLIWNYIISLELDLEYLNDMSMENIIAYTYETVEKSVDSFDLANVETLKISRGYSSKCELLNLDFNLNSDTDGECYSFRDKNNEKNTFTARLVEVDIWGEVIPSMEDAHSKAIQAFSEEEKELHEKFENNTLQEDYEKICPRDKNLLCVAYKSELQLDFYTKNYLNKEMEKNSTGAFFIMNDKDTGERMCILDPIDKGEVESLEVELFCLHKIVNYDDIIVKCKEE